MGTHIIEGEFQSDKYPTTPRGKVPLSVKDKTAQDLLRTYAQRRRTVDAEFSDDLESALAAAGHDTSLEQRVEQNANLVKWCVHVIGPDDIYAEPSHAAAVAKAEQLNRAVHQKVKPGEEILCFAFADMWPLSAEQHAQAMKDEQSCRTVACALLLLRLQAGARAASLRCRLPR